MASFSFGTDPTTKKRSRRTIYAPDEKTLKREVADLKARGGGSLQARLPGTVGELVDRWLRDDVEPNRSANTFRNYEALWRLHGLPHLANVKVEDFGPADVDRMFTALRKSGQSNSVLQRLATVLHRAFVISIRRREYTRANPFALVERPTHRPAEARALSVAEARKFLAAAKGDRYEALWILLLTAGLRLGEALALEIGDVDFKKGTVTIRRSFVEVKGGVEVGPTKTKGSRRLVDVGQLALDALKVRAKAAEEEGATLLFGTTLGSEMRRSNLRRSHFEPIIASAKLGRLRIHDLRHTMTSLGIAEGVGVKILAERLGHSTTRLASDRYAHVLPRTGRIAATAIDAILAKKAPAKPRPSARRGSR